MFPVLYNTVEGARSIKPELIEVARSFRSSEWALWREVMLPYTLPYTMTGVRQAIGRALVGMVAAEFFLSSTGLGQIIMTASQNFDTAGVFASILVIGLIGVGLDADRLDDRAPFRALAAVTWPDHRHRQSPVAAAAVAPHDARRALPRLIAGLVILLPVGRRRARLRAGLCRQAERASSLAIPKVIVDPAFLEATGGDACWRSPKASPIAIVVRHRHRPADRPQPSRRPRACGTTSTASTPCR